MSDEILITTGARLHFGFFAHRPNAEKASESLDSMASPLGRSNYGGIGLMIDSPGVVVRAATSDSDRVIGPADTSVGTTQAAEQIAQRVMRLIAQYRSGCPADRQPPRCAIEIRRVIPSHCGLGSGTQLALAVAQALALLARDGQADVCTLARRMARGRRSAIGIHGFLRGGFLVDGGKTAEEEIGRRVARADVPAAWRFVLVTPSGAKTEGLSGQEEIGALERLPGMPVALTERLCRLVLLEMLPALEAADVARFGESLTEFGRSVGSYFQPVQGGEYADPQMAQLARWLDSEGIRGIAQTSWGPTIAICCSDADRARALNDRILADARFRQCGLQIAAPLNTGAAIQL